MAQYGIKEVMNMVVCEYNPIPEQAKPILTLDYCQVTDVANQAERLDIQGGRGNKKLLSFDHSKVATMNITIPLVDMKMLSILSGDGIVNKTSNIFKKEILTVQAGVTNTNKVVLSQTALTTSSGNPTVFVNKLDGFRDFGEAFTFEKYENLSATGTIASKQFQINNTGGGTNKEIHFKDSEVQIGDEIVVCYSYQSGTTVDTMAFNPEKFAKAVTIKGESLFRNQYTEEDEVYNFIVYKGKFQMNYTLSMNATSATVLETVLDMYAYKDKTTQEEKYYEWIKDNA